MTMTPEAKAKIAEAQRKRWAKQHEETVVSKCQHQWVADEYLVVPGGMFLKWVICPSCDAKKQIRE